MSDRLAVELFGHAIGEVAIAGSLRSPEDWSFAYDPKHLVSNHPFALSVALPLRDAPYRGAIVRNWFCNLLPEGTVRDAIATRLRLTTRDDFALLAAIGGECAGAVSLRPVDQEPTAPPDDDETDLETLLHRYGSDVGEGMFALLGTPLRLSLAGAQDKIAVVADANGRLRLPVRGEASSHILKPDSRRFRGLCELEALGLALARAVGLRTASANPVEIAGHRALLVERYDRIATTDAGTRRLHQEDFCQALGYPPELKYESQGGPGLAQCSALIRDLRLGPVAVQGLLDWVVFNALIGNADAHGKNLALLCDRDGRRSLAPFYDLVPTLTLPERLVERTPAMRIGAAERIDAVGDDDWRDFARQTGYAPRFVLDRVAAMAARLVDGIDTTCDTLVEQGADEARLRRAAQLIEDNARRLSDARR